MNYILLLITALLTSPALKVLQKQYEDYYQGCDRSIDIILMGTLEDLALSLAQQCDSHNLTHSKNQLP